MRHTFEEAQEAMIRFRDERDWKQFHNPKDLAISISIEAAELLEIFQWSGPDTSGEKKRAKIEEELADVMLYCISLADRMEMNVPEILLKKIERNAIKYPADECRGSSAKYDQLHGQDDMDQKE